MKKTFNCIAFLDETEENTRVRLANLPVREQALFRASTNCSGSISSIL